MAQNLRVRTALPGDENQLALSAHIPWALACLVAPEGTYTHAQHIHDFLK